MPKSLMWAPAPTLWLLLAARVLMGSGDLPAQQRSGPRQELTRQQVASLRSAIQALGGRAIIGFKPVEAERGMKPDGTPALSPDQVRDQATSLRPMGVVLLRQFQRIPAVAVRMDPSRLEELLANPNIEYVEPDELHVPNGFNGNVRPHDPPVRETSRLNPIVTGGPHSPLRLAGSAHAKATYAAPSYYEHPQNPGRQGLA